METSENIENLVPVEKPSDTNPEIEIQLEKSPSNVESNVSQGEHAHVDFDLEATETGEDKASEIVEEPEPPKCKRIFIDNIDTYHGSNISKYLAFCTVGATLQKPAKSEDFDGEEEALEESKSVSESYHPAEEESFEIFGTLKNKDTTKPEHVQEIFEYNTREQLYEQLFTCDLIVYDIMEDPDKINEANWMVTALHNDCDKIDTEKTFILISSVLSWGRSQPLDLEDLDIPFTEEDYRTRKPHPNYREHVNTEKTVIKCGKTVNNKFSAYVISSGLTYGCGESIFHFFFKSAWQNAAQLPCFGSGQNILPTIHIKDLAAVIQNMADTKPKIKYLVAVDDSLNNLEDIVKSISQNLGTGQIKYLAMEEALLLKDIRQYEFDQLLINFRMDAVYIKESMHMTWVAQTGMVEAMPQLVKEYKASRNLLPTKLFIHGPPAVGKTVLSERLSKHYNLHHIQLQHVLDEATSALEHRYLIEGDEEASDDEDNEEKQLARKIQSAREEARDRGEVFSIEDVLEDHQITKFVREKLQSMQCQNQGFVLDGYPRTHEQAKDLFAIDDGEESTAEETRQISTDPLITPSHIFALNAPDEFLKDRVLNMPEIKMIQTYRTDTSYARLLAEYRENNHEDESKNVISVFGEEDTNIEHLDVTADKSLEMDNIFAQVIEKVGGAISLDESEHEKEEQRLDEVSREMKRQAEEELVALRNAQQEEEQRKQVEQTRAQAYEKSLQEEMDILTEASIPLRNYLMTFVLPTLIKGLTATCQERPDPVTCIDFLAEYLFKNNPQIGYNFPGPLPWREDTVEPVTTEQLVEILRQSGLSGQRSAVSVSGSESVRVADSAVSHV